MKRINKIYKVLLVFVVIILCATKVYADLPDLGPQVGSSVIINNIEYTLSLDGRAFVYDARKAIGDIVIPSTVRKGNKVYTVIEIGSASFSSNKSITSVKVPSSVKKIGQNAFNECHNLRNVVINDGTEIIEQGAFENCYSLTLISLSNSIKQIETFTFFGCKNLREITIPSSVEKIGKFAFKFCDNLEKVTFLNADAEVYEDAFNKCPKIKFFGWNGKTYNNRKVYKVFNINGVKTVMSADVVKSAFKTEEEAAKYYVGEYESD